MAKKPWIFSTNFIANGIGNNYTLALVMAKFHLEALTVNNADPEIAIRETIFETLYNNLLNADVTKGVSTGERIESTATVEEIFQFIIDTDLPLWQNQIAAVYPRKSATYKGLFNGGNKVFESGRIELRIKAVETLANATLAKGTLDAVSALITIRFNALDAARNTQLGLKSTITGLSATQITAINMMTDAHFIDHGLVITKFSQEPKKIASFTDVQSLQNHIHSDTYVGTVNASKTKTAVKRHDFIATSTFSVTSTMDMQIWVIDSSNNIIKPEGILIQANITKEVGFPGLGNFENRVVQVKNLSLVKGFYEIVFT